ncbi:MAG: DUF1211 domain-containing protein [Methanospirillum sp.]|uniref:TMEM175 family protein n=1 Tax=Methanospirillum sp. TaxID=45200 RepID=UPI00236D8D3A|nr:TMEM175 family protein [Methanospirillum sp.]MDD1729389.1 DUF1211 domain-containing protein [Methanospirillum sp.]
MRESEPVRVSPVPQDMLEILMNGVFAFAMTLIVKNNIPFPSGSAVGDLDYFIRYLFGIFFDGVSFIFTFIVLAFFYLLVFEIMKRVYVLDRLFVYLDFGFMLAIVFIPVSSLLYSYSDMPVPYGILFHMNIILCGLILFCMWGYASGPGDLIQPAEGSHIRNLSLRIGAFFLTACIGFLFDSQEFLYGEIPLMVLYLIPILVYIRYSEP